MTTNLSVRELQPEDVPLITNYWLQTEPGFMEAMGVDLDKMPAEAFWYEMLHQQIQTPYKEKQSYCTIWQMEGKAIGHCNVNKIIYGQEAYMHLHLWQKDSRQKGVGTQLVKMSLSYFFRNLQLKTVYCEPYALNPAPNKTLERVGFSFVKEYTTIPGFLNFEQPVCLWEMSEERFLTLGS